MGTWKQVGLVCDLCEHYSDWGEYSMADARDTAKEEGWVRRNGMDVCPSCADVKVI